jgi:hypothetical protein
MKPRFSLALSVVFLPACGTPQERAVWAYCHQEGLKAYPEVFEMRPVTRMVQVGTRVVGSKERCETTRRVDDKGVEIKETVCKRDDVTEPVFEPRVFSEPVDTNADIRRNFEKGCSADALQRGMFADKR